MLRGTEYIKVLALTLSIMLIFVLLIALLGWSWWNNTHDSKLLRGCYKCGNTLHCDGIDLDGSRAWFQEIELGNLTITPRWSK